MHVQTLVFLESNLSVTKLQATDCLLPMQSISFLGSLLDYAVLTSIPGF